LHEDLSWAGTGTIYAATLPSVSEPKKFKSRRPSRLQPTNGFGVVNQSAAPLARDDPQANDKEAQHDSGDQPPGLCARWSILSGEIPLAIRTALGVFMDLAAAVWTRNGRFVLIDIF
jgi:hypothetical protein